MSSDKIDKWVKKNPESWAKLAENKKNKQLTFEQFKKKFLKGARNNGKYKAVKEMTNSQISEIYNASGNITTKNRATNAEQKAFSIKKINVKRNNKEYTRSVQPRWQPYTLLAINLAAKEKPRSKQYKEYVNSIVESTGRSRQAVVKKIQRTRKVK